MPRHDSLTYDFYKKTAAAEERDFLERDVGDLLRFLEIDGEDGVLIREGRQRWRKTGRRIGSTRSTRRTIRRMGSRKWTRENRVDEVEGRLEDKGNEEDQVEDEGGQTV